MKKLLWTIVLVMAVGGLWYSLQDKTPVEKIAVEEVDTLTISEKTEIAETSTDSVSEITDSTVVVAE